MERECDKCGAIFKTQDKRAVYCGKECQYPTEKERWESKINKTEHCHLWTGTTQNGYGVFATKGKPVKAHRYSYSTNVGIIPDGKCVLHACDNPLCVNPDHLFLGTILENNKDRNSKGRCAKGEKSGVSLLTEKEVIEIRYRAEVLKIPTSLIANYFGISKSSTRSIIKKQTWKHV